MNGGAAGMFGAVPLLGNAGHAHLNMLATTGWCFNLEAETSSVGARRG